MEEALLAEIGRLRRRVAVLEGRLEQASRERTDESRQIHAILSALPDIIFLVGADGRYLKVFTGKSALLAVPPSEIIGKTVHEILPPAHAASFQHVLDETLRTGQTQTIDYELPVENGSTRWFAATTMPVSLENQACVMWVARDVTERKQAEQEIQRARDAAVESNRLKSEFLANMSHELRTPLNGVMGMTRLLDETALDDDQRQWVHNIDTCAQSLLSVINDILDFSKMEAGALAIRSQAFDLSATVRNLVTLFRDQDGKRPVVFTFAIDPALPSRVIGDPDRIRQILLNLLSNAAKFTREGKIAVHVSRAAEGHEPLWVRFDVVDTGTGIDPEAMENIFEPFVQGGGTRSRGGTGLGLAIVKGLVERMDGKLQVTSRPGEGSTFSFTLPLEHGAVAGETDKTTAEAAAETAAEATTQTTTQTTTAAGAARVLLVEDNPVGRLIGHHLLTSLGCIVDQAGNGEEAVAAVARGPCDLVLMDCRMPVLDGYEAARRIRAGEPPGRRVPIIALTAHAMQGDQEACLAAGMDDYLTKPLAREDLEAALRKWLPAPSRP